MKAQQIMIEKIIETPIIRKMFLTHRPSTDPQLPASSFYRRKNQKETKKLKAREGKKKGHIVCLQEMVHTSIRAMPAPLLPLETQS